MKGIERNLIWGRFLWILLWGLILGGIVYDQVRTQFINPLLIMMLMILVVGALLSRWRNQPVISTKGWLPRTIFAAVLLILAGGYILIRIFTLK